jgi:hypothetical protein
MNSHLTPCPRISISRWFAPLMFGAILALVSPATTGSASAADINGGSSWGGWTSAGQSTNLGIWAAGSTSGVYELYTTSFIYSGQSVTGSPLGDTNLTGFATGSRILGLGIRGVSGLPAYNPPAVWPMFPTFLFDLQQNSYNAATSVGGSDGRTAPATYGHTGDFNIQVNGDFNNAYRPNVLTLQTTDGTFWGGAGTFTGYGGGNAGQLQTIIWPNVRSFYVPSNGSLQVMFNLDGLQSSVPGIGTIGSNLGVVYVVPAAGGGDTRASISNITVVPEPTTFVLATLATGLMALIARKRKRRAAIAH